MTTTGLRGVAAVAMMLLSSGDWAAAQQSTQQQSSRQSSTAPYSNSAGGDRQSHLSEVPDEPKPQLTVPFDMRSGRNYTRPNPALPNPFAPYEPIDVAAPVLTNSVRLDQIVKDGKIYLSLADAIALALENNFDIAIQRYNLDIADTDVLRAQSGNLIRGVSSGVVSGTLGGASSLLASGGGPGGTSVSSGGAAAGTSGQVESTNGGGPAPELLDPLVTGTVQGDFASTPTTSILSGSTGTSTANNSITTNTQTYDFQYQQGFTGGELLQVTFDNTRTTTNSTFTTYSPAINSSLRFQVTQHLLQGRGTFINRRFIVQAKRDRQITDSAFRQQVLYTVNQVENIYWGLVSAYEDEQAKEEALKQSTKLSSDNRKQLEIGTLAPLDVVNSDAAVASDQQALTTSQTTLEYQQLIIKQAIARNLQDPRLTAAPVIPTDRISLDPLPEESVPAETLVAQAVASRPEVEQSVLALENQALTVKAYKNGLLPTLDAFGYYQGQAIGGAQSPNCQTFGSSSSGTKCPPGTYPTIGYGTVFGNLFNDSNPDKGVGVTLNIPLRNRAAQADQARAQLEYRQAQMRLQQLLVQVRIQVVNAQFAITQDRATVMSARAAQNYASRSLDAERKKYRLGASTTANVLQQSRNLATAEDNLITAETTYARDRASFSQILANTLEKYNINLGDTAKGVVSQMPVVPGLQPPGATPPPTALQEKQTPENPAGTPGILAPEVTTPQPEMQQLAPPPPVEAVPGAGVHPPGNGPQ